MKALRAAAKAALTGTAALALLACEQPAGDGTAASRGADGAGRAPAADGAYVVPRTAWGDPDLEGKWPGTRMVGVPMQRPEALGVRNVLTDEEFAAREAQFAQQAEQDSADFDLDAATSTPGGDVGGPVSPPPHWLERGEPQRQASLIVDPPNGRMPPLTAEARRRVKPRRARFAQTPRPGRLLHRPQPLRPLHHARHRGLDPAGDLQQRQPDRAVAGLRRDRQRDDPRDAHRPARRPAARRLRDQAVARRFARPLGRRHARRRDDELHGPHRRSA